MIRSPTMTATTAQRQKRSLLARQLVLQPSVLPFACLLAIECDEL
jgi:hypothetical protein